MLKAGRWLLAVAGLALVVGMAGDGAEAKALTAKARKHRAVVHRARTLHPVRPRLVIVPPPVIVQPAYQPPPAEAYSPAPDVAAYRQLDEAQAMIGAVGSLPPDFRFALDGVVHAAWQLRDGGLVIVDGADGRGSRAFFYPPDTALPFLARDAERSYGFERGELVAVYDRDGRFLTDPAAQDDAAARALIARGRALWYAARTQPPPRAAAGANDLWLSLGGGWGDDRNGYRSRADDGRRDRDDRYRGEREDRAARGDRRTPHEGFGLAPPATGSTAGVADRRDGYAGGRDRRSAGAVPPPAMPTTDAAAMPPMTIPVAPDRPTHFGGEPGVSGNGGERRARMTTDATAPEQMPQRGSEPGAETGRTRAIPSRDVEPAVAAQPAPSAPPPQPTPPPQASEPPPAQPAPALEPDRPPPRPRSGDPDTVERPQ